MTPPTPPPYPITDACRPVFPCWLYGSASFAKGTVTKHWVHFTDDPVEIMKTIYSNGHVTHWHPDQPTAPEPVKEATPPQAQGMPTPGHDVSPDGTPWKSQLTHLRTTHPLALRVRTLERELLAAETNDANHSIVLNLLRKENAATLAQLEAVTNQLAGLTASRDIAIQDAKRGFERAQKAEERLQWLHDCSTGCKDPEGFEWGIYRVKFDAHGQNPEVRATFSDFSDLDAEMAREKAAAGTTEGKK